MAAIIPFTILCNGVEKSLADWGIEDLEFNWENLTLHTLTFTVGGRAIDAANIFPYGATVEIWQNRVSAAGLFHGGKRWFYGSVEPWDLVGSASAEDQIGQIVNPWLWLRDITYEMLYTQTTAGIPVQLTTNRVVLGVLYDQATAQPKQINTGDQIKAALQWAISKGAPIQIGNIAPWAFPPSDFQKSISCAEVILKMWRIESDFVVVWDYSTLPYPTIHCLKGNTINLDPTLTAGQKAALALTPLNIDLNAGNWLEKVHIKPRPDWQKSGFNIDYDQINTQGNSQYLQLGNDHYPDPLPSDALSNRRRVNLYFDLAGSRVASGSESAPVTSAPFDITSLAQWKKWKSELNAPTITGATVVTIADANHPAPSIVTQELDLGGNPIAYNAANAHELLDGSYHDWMATSALAITAQKVRATAWLQINHKNGKKEFKQVTKEFTALSYNTNYVSTPVTVTTTTVQSYAEQQPIGLARVMYLAWQSLAAEGSITCVEKEISGVIGFSNCLNFITPLQPAWAALNAVIQSISGSARRGATNVRFGAPMHLTAAQLINLTQVCRFRVPSLDIAFLFGGALASGGGTVRHPRKTHSHAAEHGADHQTIHVVSTSPNPAGEAANNNKGTIALDATPSVNGGAEIVPRTISAALADLDTADKKQAKMQIWNLPVGGVTKKVAVLATDTPDAIVSGGGGGGGDYNPLIAWKAGQIAYVANTMTISGILILAGTYLAIQDSPVDSLGNPVLPTGGQVPQFPVPAVGAYWRHSAFGDQPVTSCSNLVAIFSVNASAPLSL